MSEAESHWQELPSWRLLEQTIQQLIAEETFTAISLQLYDDGFSPALRAGVQQPGLSLSSESLFLVASLTKPVIAATVLKFAQRGYFSLNDRVSSIHPDWNRGEKRTITIRHLLSHTSGLPDQLPDNLELRAGQASLDEFYQRILSTDLEFSPGTRARYQSMGFVVLGKLLEYFANAPLSQILAEEIFAPLGMQNSYLGLDETTKSSEILSRVARIQLNEEQREQEGNWNSTYWQSLGAPWGGMLSTPEDLLKFCTATFVSLEEPTHVLSNSLFAEASTNQLKYFDKMNERDRRVRPWGLGWRLNWPTHRETFGDLLSEDVVGHWGATGSLMWVDDRDERACVICTSLPTTASRSQIIRLSNIALAVMDEYNHMAQNDEL